MQPTYLHKNRADAAFRWLLACVRVAPEYVTPSRGSDGFNCPFCGAFAHQRWPNVLLAARGSGYVEGPNIGLFASECERCGRTAVWIGDNMVHPSMITVPMPHDDLPSPARESYDEAREIAGRSPRAAAALLRLTLQELMPLVGAKSSNLNKAVGELVALGLPPLIQQAMDSVRVIGNNAVHPGTIDLNDDPKVALALFELVNLVVEVMITQPRAIADVYNRLPAAALQQIEERDS